MKKLPQKTKFESSLIMMGMLIQQFYETKTCCACPGIIGKFSHGTGLIMIWDLPQPHSLSTIVARKNHSRSYKQL